LGDLVREANTRPLIVFVVVRKPHSAGWRQQITLLPWSRQLGWWCRYRRRGVLYPVTAHQNFGIGHLPSHAKQPVAKATCFFLERPTSCRSRLIVWTPY